MMWVLIVVWIGGYGIHSPIRVGDYVSKAQCEAAAKFMEGDVHYCVPEPKPRRE